MQELIIITNIAKAFLDEEGYLMPLEQWDKNVGWLIARTVMPDELTDDHWRIIDYIRQYYVEFGIVPPIRKMCRDTGFNLSSIYRLFPMGVTKGPCRIAGIPSAIFKLPQTTYYP